MLPVQLIVVFETISVISVDLLDGESARRCGPFHRDVPVTSSSMFDLLLASCFSLLVSNVPEQSFLLSDREHNVKRPGLIVCGRTVVRAPPLKGQDDCPNYLGTLVPKVQSFLVDFHTEM